MKLANGKIELRKDGFWAIHEGQERGPFEFMTAATLALICLEEKDSVKDLFSARPRLTVIDGGKSSGKKISFTR
jgi:hypothetical protein